jgi:hypothetical protein
VGVAKFWKHIPAGADDGPATTQKNIVEIANLSARTAISESSASKFIHNLGATTNLFTLVAKFIHAARRIKITVANLLIKSVCFFGSASRERKIQRFWLQVARRTSFGG